MRFSHPNLCAVLALGALALSLAGCGRRGPLEPPPGAAATNAPLTGTPDAFTLPKNTAEPLAPSAAALGEPRSTNKTEPAQPAPAPAAHRPFFLDPLL